MHCRGEACRQAGPGDHVVLQGVSLPLSAGGFARGLISETIFDCHKIFKMNKSESEDEQPMTQDEVNQIMTDNFYNKLANVNTSTNFIFDCFRVDSMFTIRFIAILILIYSRSRRKFSVIQM